MPGAQDGGIAEATPPSQDPRLDHMEFAALSPYDSVAAAAFAARRTSVPYTCEAVVAAAYFHRNANAADVHCLALLALA